MESFFRYISYVDYYKKGEKIKNVGFLRWKLQNGMHQIELQLKEVDCPQGSYEIKEKNTGKLIGDVIIDKGIGEFRRRFTSMTVSGEMYIDTVCDRLYLHDLEGFVIQLNSNDYLSVPVRFDQEENIQKFSYGKEQYKKIDNNIEIQDTKAASENVLIEGIEEKYIEPVYIERVNNEKILNDKQNNQQPILKKEIEIIEPIHEDKWQQLCKDYPNVHPFPSNKVFLSIKPEDFIILQQEYQKLVHNSFLLHGFYNYGHMILGKLSEDEKTPIYIGVPGVYYEQEKRAAQMFGFVGFESTEHPVQAGSYGYYMIEVEI